MKKATRFILRHAAGRHVLLSGAAFLLMAAVIMPAAVRDFLSLSNGVPPLDLLPWYTSETAFKYLQAYGQEGRKLYLFILLAADLVFPIVYTAFFCLLLGWLVKKLDIRHERLVLFPLMVCIFDLMENACLVGMLCMWPLKWNWLAIVAGGTTFLRWTFFALTLLSCLLIFGKWKLKSLSEVPKRVL